MFEAAELGVKVGKEEYKELAGELRLELLRHQLRLRDDGRFSVLVLLAGDDRQGCDGALGMLNEWMDPRGVETSAFGRSSDEERERPDFFRYWRRLPANGRVGVFLGAWPAFGILERVRGQLDHAGLDRWIRHVNCFEQSLVDEGVALVKLWLHAPRKAIEVRLESAEGDRGEAWRVHEADREIYADYDFGRQVSEQALSVTSTEKAPWHVVESTDWRARNLAVARKVLRAMSKRLAERAPEAELETIFLAREGVESARTVLDRVDLSRSLEKETYERALAKEQKKIRGLTQRAFEAGVSSVLVFEGWDAAGKGGAVRRLTAAMPPSLFRVVPIAAPNDEERAHPWLWRFWRQLPRAGEIVLFDRSWYGRVLVERVEGFAETKAWRRAYPEINDFEEQLAEHGTLVHKYWLHVDTEEQLLRFRERESSPLKQYKITEEDWRNRERWDDYERAVNEMVARTSTAHAPWTLVAGNDKRIARVQVLHTFRKRLEQALDARG